MSSLGVAAVVSFVSITGAHAAGAPGTAAGSGVDKFDYPELTVTPRASDRIEMEAGREEARRWSSQLPILVPSAAVFAAGIIQLGNTNPESDPGKGGAIAGLVAGGGWLAYTILSSMNENTYANAVQELKSMPRGSTREQLTRERMAEEVLHRRARQARLTRILATVTLAGASGYMIATAQEDKKNYTDAQGNVVVGSGTSRVIDIGAAVLSLAPLFFPSHYEEIANQQEQYKKRIYAPVASSALLPVASTGSYVPGMTLTWRF